MAKVAIVDYGLGNLFSVQHVCSKAGLAAVVTANPAEVAAAEAVILPGVGAFGDAMRALDARGLSSAIRDVVAAGKPLMGVCLGLQLLMTESQEFGRHRGLGLFGGDVVRFDDPKQDGKILKVPQVQWNRVYPARPEGFAGTTLAGVVEGDYMYFVHSYYVRPADPAVVLSTTRYGHFNFCSSVQRGGIFACQFHPERSGLRGIEVYQNFAARIQENSNAL